MSAHITAQTVRMLGGARGHGRIPRQRPPEILEVDYTRALRSVIEPGLVAFARGLSDVPALVLRGRSSGAFGQFESQHIRRVIDAAYETARKAIDPQIIEHTAQSFAMRVVDFNARELGAQVAGGLGVQIPMPSTGLAAIVHRFVAQNRALADDVLEDVWSRAMLFATDAVTGGRLDAELPIEAAIENVQLIGGVRTSTREKIASALSSAHAAGDLRVEQMQELLVRRLHFGVSRAEFIAVDQIGKLNGQVNQARQTALGITHFRWITKLDRRVRPEHRRRHGKRYAWSAPPNGEIPGVPVRCRCHGEPDVTDIRRIAFEPDELAAMRGRR